MAKDDEIIVREQIRKIIEESKLNEQDVFSASGIAPMPSFSRTKSALGQLGNVAKVGAQSLALQNARLLGSTVLQLVNLVSPAAAQQARSKLKGAMAKAQNDLIPKEKAAWKSVTDNLGAMGGDAWILAMAMAPGPMLGALAVKTGTGLTYGLANALTGGTLEGLVDAAGAEWKEISDKVYERNETSEQKLSDLVVKGQTPKILKFLEMCAAIAGVASAAGNKITDQQLDELTKKSNLFFGLYDKQKTDVIAAKSGVASSLKLYGEKAKELSAMTDKNSIDYKRLSLELDLCKYAVAHEYFNLFAATAAGFQDQLKNVRGKISEVNNIAANVDKYSKLFEAKNAEFLKLVIDAQKKIEDLSKQQTK